MDAIAVHLLMLYRCEAAQLCAAGEHKARHGAGDGTGSCTSAVMLRGFGAG